MDIFPIFQQLVCFLQICINLCHGHFSPATVKGKRRAWLLQVHRSTGYLPTEGCGRRRGGEHRKDQYHHDVGRSTKHCSERNEVNQRERERERERTMGKEGGAVGREVSSSVDGGETMQREQVGARGAAGLGRRSQRREKQFRGAGELAGNTRCRATAHSNHRVRGAFVALGERRCARALAECSQAVFSRGCRREYTTDL